MRLDVLMHSSFNVPPQHFSHVEASTIDWTIAAPWFFSFSAIVDLLLLDNSVQTSCSSQTDCLPDALNKEQFLVDSMTARCRSPVAVKQAPNPPLSIIMLVDLYEVFVLLYLVLCAIHCAWRPDVSILVSSIQRTLSQNTCGLLRCNFANRNCAAMFFSERRRFLSSERSNFPVRGKFDLSFSCNPDKYELQLTEKSSLASRWQTIQSYTAGCLASTYKPKNIPLVNIVWEYKTVTQ